MDDEGDSEAMVTEKEEMEMVVGGVERAAEEVERLLGVEEVGKASTTIADDEAANPTYVVESRSRG
ncbi:hypothetical protein AMTR_s00024p00253130 [Amborella trichopoda]|uniref:Uncharacterized protein n=1 Tax=Amborella trichopoda TaxID=13333 RepID=W1PVN9_AMBTC|nr:hypothetical protein AMTR_s00024p00253130 [Amborella trichopoda]